MITFEVHIVRLSQQPFISFVKYILTLRRQITVVVGRVRSHPQSALAPCRQHTSKPVTSAIDAELQFKGWESDNGCCYLL